MDQNEVPVRLEDGTVVGKAKIVNGPDGPTAEIELEPEASRVFSLSTINDFSISPISDEELNQAVVNGKALMKRLGY